MILILTQIRPTIRDSAIAANPSQPKNQIVKFVTQPILIDTTGLIAMQYPGDKKQQGITYENENPAKSLLMTGGEPIMVVEYIERIQFLGNQVTAVAAQPQPAANSYWEIKRLIANDEGADEYGDYALCIHGNEEIFSIINLLENIAAIIEEHAIIQRFMSHADAARVIEALSDNQKRILLDALLPPLSLRKK